MGSYQNISTTPITFKASICDVSFNFATSPV